MRRHDSFGEQLTLALQIILAVVALAVVALLAPVDWERYFGKVRTGGGESDER
jgi:hypothetical protein